MRTQFLDISVVHECGQNLKENYLLLFFDHNVFEIHNRPVKIRHQNSTRILHQLQGSSARLVTPAILGK